MSKTNTYRHHRFGPEKHWDVWTFDWFREKQENHGPFPGRLWCSSSYLTFWLSFPILESIAGMRVSDGMWIEPTAEWEARLNHDNPLLGDVLVTKVLRDTLHEGRRVGVSWKQIAEDGPWRAIEVSADHEDILPALRFWLRWKVDESNVFDCLRLEALVVSNFKGAYETRIHFTAREFNNSLRDAAISRERVRDRLTDKLVAIGKKASATKGRGVMNLRYAVREFKRARAQRKYYEQRERYYKQQIFSSPEYARHWRDRLTRQGSIEFMGIRITWQQHPRLDPDIIRLRGFDPEDFQGTSQPYTKLTVLDEYESTERSKR